MKCSTFSLKSDGCSKIKNDPAINFITGSPELFLFIESVWTAQLAHEAKFISEDIPIVIRKYKLTVFSGAVLTEKNTTRLQRNFMGQV